MMAAHSQWILWLCPYRPDSIVESQIGWFRGRALQGGDRVNAKYANLAYRGPQHTDEIDYGSTAECHRFVRSWYSPIAWGTWRGMGNVVRIIGTGEIWRRGTTRYLRSPRDLMLSLRRLLRWTPAVGKDSDEMPSELWTIFPEDTSFRLG